MKFSAALIQWYADNKRDLPWRNTRDPYIIWLSEIILQQTRVEQGLPYFYRFTEAFPTLKHLAQADEAVVLKLWQGLGYYSRARNMLATAKQIQLEHKGEFPGTFDALKKLKGIGDYSAAAIASFAFGGVHPVVDGNVYRLLSRYFGIETAVNTSAAKKEFTAVAESVMEKKAPGLFNQAIMEFGALQCRPVNPDCPGCIFLKSCFAAINNKVRELPVKLPARKPRNRYFHYFFIRHRGNFYIRQRKESDIWKHLYELPLIETPVKTGPGMLWKKHARDLFRDLEQPGSKPYEIRHQLTHQTIHAAFYSLEIKKGLPPVIQNEFTPVAESKIHQYAFPKLIENYFNTIFNADS